MKLNRLLLRSLKRWAQQPRRLPLWFRGARQSGKTWLMLELGRTCFEYTAYFDFAGSPALQEVFASTRDPREILKGLNLISDVPILPGKTLIVFDEIQLCDHAFGSLKYFAQNAPEYAVAASGNLLEVELRRKQIFAPVGQVQIVDVWPLSFAEFLLNAAPNLYEYVEQISVLDPLPECILHEINKEFLRYQCVGGMPAAVSQLLDGHDLRSIESTLRQILSLYRCDFFEYATTTEAKRIAAIWDAIPTQLSKSNARFFLTHIHPNARSREFILALQWLCDAGLVLKTTRVSTAKPPLIAYFEPEIFKLYTKDIGLLRIMANVSAQNILTSTTLSESKSMLAKNGVANSLARSYDSNLYDWSSGAQAKVDFLIESAGRIFPVEVKAAKRVASKSLSVFAAQFDPLLSIRLGESNLKRQNKMLHVPLCLVDWLPALIRLTA